ncbi:MAG TPA: AAA family ATPase, partial [Planctomycetaceae bacterium]|nr:AAA family ATPase [Planctomycetaceae bacterium]
MSTFEKIHVQGFRRLHDVDLKLKPLNVMIGANGSGKTTLLEVFTLLAASASGDLAETISDFGGVDGNLTNLSVANVGKARFMSFELSRPVPGHQPIDYRIAVTPKGTGYDITDETLIQHSKPRKPKPMKYIESAHGRVQYYDPTSKKLKAPTW